MSLHVLITLVGVSLVHRFCSRVQRHTVLKLFGVLKVSNRPRCMVGCVGALALSFVPWMPSALFYRLHAHQGPTLYKDKLIDD